MTVCPDMKLSKWLLYEWMDFCLHTMLDRCGEKK